MSLLHRLLAPPVTRLANRFSSRPDKTRVYKALTELHQAINDGKDNLGKIVTFNPEKDKFIILSDQHKGARDGADVFALAEKNYLTALEHYYDNDFFYVNLGDSEELWQNRFVTIKRHNKATFQAERKFLSRGMFLKIYGNHDLYWDNDPLAGISLLQIYGEKIPIYEGLILRTILGDRPLEIYLTHGHQGDLQSDGNWFSKWFVSDIWGPLEAWLRINPNTPANNDQLKTAHNQMMYGWSAQQKSLLLITGHTHQPVFRSLTHIEQLYEDLRRSKNGNDKAAIEAKVREIGKREKKGDRITGSKKAMDTYYNSGCCCFDDGDITGIELDNGCIRLIKWAYDSHQQSKREILGECKLGELHIN